MEDGVIEQTEVRPESPKKIDVAALKEKHQAMKELPYINATALTENYSGKPIGQEKVLTSTIVATPRLDNWGHEYHKDWGKGELSSVEAMAVDLSRDPENFWQESDPVELIKVNGPKGPLYGVEDGSHRVAAAKLSEVLEVPAEVADLTDRKEFSTPDEATKSWWEALIYRGAIKGRIEERDSSYHLILEETPELPWIVRKRRHFVEINKVYQQVYGEEALSEVESVPQEILFKNGQAMVWENTAIREREETRP
jgi:hypothetical protein